MAWIVGQLEDLSTYKWMQNFMKEMPVDDTQKYVPSFIFV